MPPISEYAIQTNLLNKVYKGNKGQSSKHALKDFTINIRSGQIYGLLGPNGAGKSTFINILANLVLKTSGTAKILGYDIEKQKRDARSAIGIVPQELNLDPFFKPIEVLETQAGLYGVPKKERDSMGLLRTLRLEDQAYAYSRTLSGGMRRRLLIAKAMTHKPLVLVLDEPTAGVDIELRYELWDLIRELNNMGTTILLTTHYLEEAQSLCDHIGIINKGVLVADAPTQDLLKSLDKKQILIKVTNFDKQKELIINGVSSIELSQDGYIVISYQPSKINFFDILKELESQKITIIDIISKETDLEDIFLEFVREKKNKGQI
jgi:ABC-2 type transport system ATP-binding protein|tara:strand:+ start:1437 stop:2399 length:963 start_codon:yes stop_codon:yes gene_type:complete